ncbi:MAG: hypothetical protein M1829_001744 [Trizodia sp. TS-e1964]|nr:MAG: hypothetical protein M1829_001744 [Trizodia sp. TS-e1964]
MTGYPLFWPGSFPLGVSDLGLRYALGKSLPDRNCGMEDNDRQRRQIDPPGYPVPARVGSIGHTPSRQPSLASNVDRYGRPPLIPSRSPTSGVNTTRATDYGNYYPEVSHFSGSPLPTGSLYQPTYPQEQQRSQQFPQYGSNIMYNVGQASTQNTSYDPVQQYSARQSAIDALPTAFNASAQYFVGGESGSPSNTALPTQPPFPSLSYSQQQHPVSRSGLAQPYSSGMGEIPHSGPSDVLDEPDYVQAAPNYDDAYNQYQNALKRTFENTRNGHLTEAGQSLVEISDWLLSHAVELGLVRDEEELHGDRIKLWNEFNICWLSALQKEKDMLQDLLDNGQSPHPPQSIIRQEFLEKMGRDLVRLCDNMERHGLVDYQMGVWEEEIIQVLHECLDILDLIAENEGNAGTTQGGPPESSHNLSSSTVRP